MWLLVVRVASHLNPSARWRVTAWASNTSCDRRPVDPDVGAPQNSNPSYTAVEVGCWQSHTAILAAWRSCPAAAAAGPASTAMIDITRYDLPHAKLGGGAPRLAAARWLTAGPAAAARWLGSAVAAAGPAAGGRTLVSYPLNAEKIQMSACRHGEGGKN